MKTIADLDGWLRARPGLWLDVSCDGVEGWVILLLRMVDGKEEEIGRSEGCATMVEGIAAVVAAEAVRR